MKKKLWKVFAVVLTLSLIAASFVSCGDKGSSEGDVITIVAAHEETEDRAIHQSLVKFGDYIAEESGGALQLEIHPNAELGDANDCLEAIQLGTLQMTIANSANFTMYDEKFAAANFPYLFQSKEKMDAAFTEGEFGKLFKEWTEEYGFVCLGFQFDGSRCVSNNVRPIYTPEDMNGLKLRVMDSDLYIEMFKLMGANPTPMGYSEIYTALQQGTVDGQDNPAGLTYGSKFNEVLKYFSVTQHTYSNVPVVIGKDFFDGLDAEYQDIIREGAKVYLEDWQRQQESDLEADYIEKIADSGVAVNYLTEADIQMFKDAVAPIYDTYRKKLGEDTMDAILDAIGK